LNNISIKKSGAKPYRIISIELEPTHYKSDLWNTIAASKQVDAFVIYTQMKNWSPDGGHNYLKFPQQRYKHIVLSGRGFLGAISSTITVVTNIVKAQPDLVIICGYSQLQSFFALLSCFIFRRRFFLFVDEFNNNNPPGRFSFFKRIVREGLRKYCFKFASAILVCGRKGKDSAVVAGCPSIKIHDFPYVVDIERITSDKPNAIPDQCLSDVQHSRTVLFFSGRMIARKGLQTLLLSLSNLKQLQSWVLWIEGDGPEIKYYQSLVEKYGFKNRCRFLGFCQYDLHSWLVRSSDIVIIPSLEDNWGIVVDEALQLGKAVISSDATGSGHDRIVDKSNGFIFPAADSGTLTRLLTLLLSNEEQKVIVGQNARNSNNPRPIENLNTILNIMENEYK
jgi:glycosyltransferase involved in cell wall biosynthesis